jgi:hypothetical protein
MLNLRSTPYSSGHTPWSGRNPFGQGVTHVRLGATQRAGSVPDHSVTYRSASRGSISLPAQHGEPARLPRTAGPGAQQRRLPAASRSRDNRHLPRRRTIQGSDKITPVDQPRSRNPGASCLGTSHARALPTAREPLVLLHSHDAPPRSRPALSRCGESPRSGDDLLPASYLPRSNPGPGCGFPAWRGSLPTVPVPLEPAEAPRGAGRLRRPQGTQAPAVRTTSAARLAPVQKFSHRIMVRRL